MTVYAGATKATKPDLMARKYEADKTMKAAHRASVVFFLRLSQTGTPRRRRFQPTAEGVTPISSARRRSGTVPKRAMTLAVHGLYSYGGMPAAVRRVRTVSPSTPNRCAIFRSDADPMSLMTCDEDQLTFVGRRRAIPKARRLAETVGLASACSKRIFS